MRHICKGDQVFFTTVLLVEYHGDHSYIAVKCNITGSVLLVKVPTAVFDRTLSDAQAFVAHEVYRYRKGIEAQAKKRRDHESGEGTGEYDVRYTWGV